MGCVYSWGDKEEEIGIFGSMGYLWGTSVGLKVDAEKCNVVVS